MPGKPDHVVTAAADGEVHLVSMQSRAAEMELVNCSSFATVARFLPNDASVLIAAEMNGQAYLVDLREETHRTLLSNRVPKGGSTALAFDPARPWTMAYSGGRCVSLFDLRAMSLAYDQGATRDCKPFARYCPGPVARCSTDEGAEAGGAGRGARLVCTRDAKRVMVMLVAVSIAPLSPARGGHAVLRCSVSP